jgi:hypothetical protein
MIIPEDTSRSVSPKDEWMAKVLECFPSGEILSRQAEFGPYPFSSPLPCCHNKADE